MRAEDEIDSKGGRDEERKRNERGLGKWRMAKGRGGSGEALLLRTYFFLFVLGPPLSPRRALVFTRMRCAQKWCLEVVVVIAPVALKGGDHAPLSRL